MELAAQAPDRRRVFFSYSSDEVQFVARVYWHLDRSSGIEPFFFPVGDYPGNQQLHLADDFRTKLVNELHQSGVFILFCGRKFKEWQGKEVIYWLNRGDATPSPIIRINLFEKADVPKELKLEMGGSLCAIIPVSATVGSDGKLLLTEEHAFETARKICTSINVQWLPIGALPDGFMFNYEKTMISEYLEQNGRFSDEHVKMGCPMAWPSADKHPIERAISNPLTEADLGSFKDNQYIWVDARRRATINNRKRSASNNRVEDEMVFPAAGPHQNLYAGLEFLAQENIGILVSGGLAPGVNAVIDGIVSRYLVYRKGFGLGPDVSASSELTNIRGYMEGFRGLVSRIDPIQLNRFTPRIIKRNATRGGTILTTSRENRLLEDVNAPDTLERAGLIDTAVERLHIDGVRILFVIGGHGSMRAAYAISNQYKSRYNDTKLSVVGIPKTMDNDILWVWQSFGFASAVERATSLVLRLETEVRSNPRLCVAQLYGSDSGFVVSHTALGSGLCDLVLIPEMTFSMDEIERHMAIRLAERKTTHGSPFGIVVMSETALPTDAQKYLDQPYIGLTNDEKDALKLFEKNDRKFHGGTPDNLRSGALKIVSRELQARIQNPTAYLNGGGTSPIPNPLYHFANYWQRFGIFVNEPRHLVRSTVPSAMEFAYASRLGTLAMDAAMAGYTNIITSQWLTEFVLVPMQLSILGKKKVPLEGMFWKSVVSSTGQPDFTGL